MKKLLKCLHCGGEAQTKSHIVFENRGEDYRKHWNGDKYYVQCESCGIRTQDYYTEQEAYDAWNRRAQQEQPNEPLTLDELRQMESGQWVWIEVFQLLDYQCKVSAYHQKQRDYTDGKMFCCGYPGTTFGFDYADYGKTWLAYRRKPEQEG